MSSVLFVIWAYYSNSQECATASILRPNNKATQPFPGSLGYSFTVNSNAISSNLLLSINQLAVFVSEGPGANFVCVKRRLCADECVRAQAKC
jgi:hypothetical protein